MVLTLCSSGSGSVLSSGSDCCLVITAVLSSGSGSVLSSDSGCVV